MTVCTHKGIALSKKYKKGSKKMDIVSQINRLAVLTSILVVRKK